MTIENIENISQKDEQTGDKRTPLLSTSQEMKKQGIVNFMVLPFMGLSSSSHVLLLVLEL